MAELVLTYPGGKTSRHELTLKPQSLGRDPACDIQVDDPSISRKHADIRGDAQGGFMVRDLGSKNGTFVNDLQITSTQIRPSDAISFGSVSARLELVEDARSTATIMLEDDLSETQQSISFAGRTRKLRLSEKRLQMLYEISDRLTALRDREELLGDIMKICLETFEFERGAIGLKQREGRGLDWPVIHNLRGADGEIKISRTMLKQALEDGRRAIFTESAQGNIDPTVSMVQQGMRCAMCVPIAYSDEILGVIYGDRTSTARNYEQEDVDFLAALARQLSIGLTNSHLLKQEQQRVILERDITLARQIQSDLFPDSLDLHPALEIAAINDPGRQVSGDYYDVVPMADGSVGLIIADVSGKGVASALLSANLQAAVRLLFPETTDLGKLAGRLNQLIYENTDSSRFITALLAIVDPQQGTFSYVSAGHHFPIQVGPTGVTERSEGANHLPFGVAGEQTYESVRLELGDTPWKMFFYTDGVIEALDAEENEYGTERLLATLTEHAEEAPAQLLQSVRQSVADFSGDVPQSDDITVIAVGSK